MNRYARPKRSCRDSRRFRNLRLDGKIQRGDGLVADHEPGLQCQRAGDGDALLLTAGELVWKRVREPPPHADEVQQPSDRFLPFPLCAHPVDLQGVANDFAHAHHRIQRRQWVLKHNLHFPPKRAQFPAGKRAHVAPLEIHPSRGGLVQSQDRAGEGRTCRCRFLRPVRRSGYRGSETSPRPRPSPRPGPGGNASSGPQPATTVQTWRRP